MMLVGVLIAFAVALISGIIVILRGQGVRARPTRTPHPPQTLSVLVLGYQSSGKTLLLASMWRELAFGGKSGIRLSADMEADVRALHDLCDQIEDPTSQGFPANTIGSTKEWKFCVQALSRSGRPTDAFSFSYFDYSGELLDKMGRGQQLEPEFELALKSADIVMGVLDGQKVARAMSGNPDGDFASTLRRLSFILMKREMKTLHIIITKWDLLDGKYELKKVIDKLKEHGPFRNVLDSPRLGGVRIIPVSSLGLNGFVHETAGHMRKVPGRPWRPVYVTAPLSCSIPDVLATDVKKLAHEGKGRARRPIVTYNDVSQIFFWVTLVFGLAMAPVAASTAVMPSLIREITLKVSADRLLGQFDRMLRRARSRGIPKNIDAPSALLRALAFLGGEVDRLEREVPAAKLMIE
jgi:hypothetical protein